MASEKGLYWVAVGVLALGVTNSFVNRHGDWIHCLANHSMEIGDRFSSHADRLAAFANRAFDRSSANVERTQEAVVRAQNRVASVETLIARHQAELARFQTEQVRVHVLQSLPQRIVVCPRKNLVLVPPQPPVVRDQGTI